ncbi:tyrosine-type recombinase/integrase [Jatrophihabitans sp. DSM 45814]
MSGHIRKTPNSTYQVRWIDPSGRERSKVFRKESDAENHVTSVQHNILSGTYVDPKAGKTTVGQMAEVWLASKINLKPSTRVRYEAALKNHVLPRWENPPLNRLNYGEIQRGSRVCPPRVTRAIGCERFTEACSAF